MIMRVALRIQKTNISAALETYELMSQKFLTHSTPTLFNAGTPRPQLSSCFLLAMQDDSIESIYDTLKQCACISKWAGGIGISMHNIRVTNSYIRGTNGSSNGIIPMLRVFMTRPSMWIKAVGSEKDRLPSTWSRSMQTCSSFLNCVKITATSYIMRGISNGGWSFFCPNEAPGLYECWVDEFKKLYEQWTVAQNPESPETLGFLKTSNPLDEVTLLSCFWSGAKLDAATTTTGYTALHYAVKHGHLTVVNSLLLNGANVDAICTERHSSPLHLAAKSGHGDVVRCLLSFDAHDDQKIVQVLGRRCTS
ncbi:hypothetical protein PsorP6_017936 [Peronosclerospora sorghi]|uniref:Uncharacterized protein n=1 Tax=Peronosclerospora sorghi TaxID=230839 RepID=A0ACC0WDQ0_9STRA|nr:hypothetical protein PsorP6_017936 [Peronosclerospora sorghi]